MSTGLKVSSLTCRYVFYRPDLNAKGGGTSLNWILKVLKRNMPKDRAERVDEKNGVYFQSYGP